MPCRCDSGTLVGESRDAGRWLDTGQCGGIIAGLCWYTGVIVAGTLWVCNPSSFIKSSFEPQQYDLKRFKLITNRPTIQSVALDSLDAKLQNFIFDRPGIRFKVHFDRPHFLEAQVHFDGMIASNSLLGGKITF